MYKNQLAQAGDFCYVEKAGLNSERGSGLKRKLLCVSGDPRSGIAVVEQSETGNSEREFSRGGEQ